jgi:uncharacterized protein
MGQPVVHFEIVGKDGEKLRSYYSDLFGWEFAKPEPDVQMDYATITREDNMNAEGVGIAGGVGTAPPGVDDWVTFYVEVPDVEAALAKAESLGGTRVSGPDQVPGMHLVLGHFTDPEGHLIGLVQATDGS